MARNPKDVCVSFFKMMSEPESGFVGDFAQFAEFFKSGLQVTGKFYKLVDRKFEMCQQRFKLFRFMETIGTISFLVGK